MPRLHAHPDRPPLAAILTAAVFAAMSLVAGCSTTGASTTTVSETPQPPEDVDELLHGPPEPVFDDQEFDRRRDRELIDDLRSRDIEARASARGVVVTLPDVLFEFGSDQMKGEALRRIIDIAEVVNFRARGRRIAVEGHTDSIGAALYNQGLSERRARAVADALIEANIARSLVSTRGYGSMFPIEPNTNDDGSDNPAGRARNRRVEIVILD
ncbi:MAG: OmpA family protein [Candidatus Binatia bacterium]